MTAHGCSPVTYQQRALCSAVNTLDMINMLGAISATHVNAGVPYSWNILGMVEGFFLPAVQRKSVSLQLKKFEGYT